MKRQSNEEGAKEDRNGGGGMSYREMSREKNR